MDNIALAIGKIVMVVGGGTIAVGIIGFIGWLAGLAWVLFSETFRDICKAESLIFEYRKYRHDFRVWMALKDGGGNG